MDKDKLIESMRETIESMRENAKSMRENAKSKDATGIAKDTIIQLKDAQQGKSNAIEKELREKMSLLETRMKQLELEKSADAAKLAVVEKHRDRALEDKDTLLAERDSLKDASIVQLETLAQLYKQQNPMPSKSITLMLKKDDDGQWRTGIFEIEDSKGEKTKWQLIIGSNGWLHLYSRNDKAISAGVKFELLDKTCTLDFGPLEPQRGKAIQMMRPTEFKEKVKDLETIEVRADFSIRTA